MRRGKACKVVEKKPDKKAQASVKIACHHRPLSTQSADGHRCCAADGSWVELDISRLSLLAPVFDRIGSTPSIQHPIIIRITPNGYCEYLLINLIFTPLADRSFVTIHMIQIMNMTETTNPGDRKLIVSLSGRESARCPSGHCQWRSEWLAKGA